MVNADLLDVHLQKQERRGGIETIVGIDMAYHSNLEAGTPWWH